MRKALLALLVCAPVFPQGSTGRVDGNITDQSGGAIVGAKVTVTDLQRGVARTLMTDTAGGYMGVGKEFARHEMVDQRSEGQRSPGLFVADRVERYDLHRRPRR